jgi:hypothetical protein
MTLDTTPPSPSPEPQYGLKGSWALTAADGARRKAKTTPIKLRREAVLSPNQSRHPRRPRRECARAHAG